MPVDNPATHLELTMIHEALILELGPAPGADRVGGEPEAVRLFLHWPGAVLPWGVAEAQAPLAMLLALPALVFKLAIGGFLLAVLETLSAKMRIFRVPEFLATAFLLAVIGMLVHMLLSTGGGVAGSSPSSSTCSARAADAGVRDDLVRASLSLIHLFTLQGATLVLSTAVGYVTHQPHLYLSAGVTFVLKVLLIPWLLHRVIDRLRCAGTSRPDQHPDDDADRHRCGDLCLQPGDADLAAVPRSPAARWASRWPACCCPS